MKTNFAITDNYAITFQNTLIDLHNNFDFVEYKYEVNKSELIMYFKKGVGKWIDKNEFDQLTLIHKNVSSFFIENENKNFPDLIIDLTFYPTKDKENANLMVQEYANDEDDIIYNFESDQTFRIGCEEIELRVS